MSDTQTNEYRHADGDTQGAAVGSELDKVLAKDENWDLVGKGSQAAQAAGEETEVTTESDQESTDEATDIDSLDRDGLNKLAADLGVVDAETLPNKGAVKDAIKAAQAAGEEG